MLAPVVASTIGDTAVVAAVAGKKIRVKSLRIYNGVATAQSVKLRSAANDLHAAVPLPLVIGGRVDAVASTEPGAFLVETNAGEALNINLTALTAVGGLVVYSLE